MVDAPGLTLRGSKVGGNTIDATGAHGTIQGGGIFDAPTPGPAGGPLNLFNSSITGNTLTGPGLTVQGGGLYINNQPLTRVGTVIANNRPDQCFGC